MSKIDKPFELRNFLPYQLAILADAVSRATAQLYLDEFSLTRAEWRVVAALGDNPDMTGKQITRITTLDKMQVSRAVKRLEKNNYVARTEDSIDRRNKVLRLTDVGEAMLAKIIPLVQEREACLLEDLTLEEQEMFAAISTKIRTRALAFANSNNNLQDE